MEHQCPECHRVEETDEAHCSLHIWAMGLKARAKEILTELWKNLRDGMGRNNVDLERSLLSVAAYKTIGLITDEEAELFAVRMQFKCPGHDDEGGRVWCAYCGNIKPALLEEGGTPA